MSYSKSRESVPDITRWATAAPSVEPAKKLDEKPTTPVIRQPIMKPAKPSPIRQLADTLSSDGAITSAIAETSGDGVGISEVIKAASVVCKKPLSLLNVNVKPGSILNAKNVVPTMPKYVSLNVAHLGKWWRRERKDRTAVKALPNRDLDSMIVEGV